MVDRSYQNIEVKPNKITIIKMFPPFLALRTQGVKVRTNGNKLPLIRETINKYNILGIVRNPL